MGSCSQLLRLLYLGGPQQKNAVLMLRTLSKGVELGELLYQIHLPSLGLPLRFCSQYCAAMEKVQVSEALIFHGPDDLFALASAHRQLSALSKALRREAPDRQRHVMLLGPPVGALLCQGESWLVVDFSFQDHVQEGLPACSEWYWLDVPRLTGRQESDG